MAIKALPKVSYVEPESSGGGLGGILGAIAGAAAAIAFPPAAGLTVGAVAGGLGTGSTIGSLAGGALKPGQSGGKVVQEMNPVGTEKSSALTRRFSEQSQATVNQDSKALVDAYKAALSSPKEIQDLTVAPLAQALLKQHGRMA